MKKVLWLTAALLIPVVSAWATQVTVNQSGSGNFTKIMDAINSGATNILITDSGHYFEDLQIGDPTQVGPAAGPPTFLGASATGANRPTITPVNAHIYVDTYQSARPAGFGVFAANCVISNLIIEANPDSGNGTAGAMLVCASNVLVLNCKFEIATNTVGTLGSADALLVFAQQGGGGVPTPGGAMPDGGRVVNCEFLGVAPDLGVTRFPLEPIEGPGPNPPDTDGGFGYLGQIKSGNGTGQGSGYCRFDIWSQVGQPVTVTFTGCWFHYDLDYGIFPTDRNGAGAIPENLTVVCNNCRFDANGKFQIRGRGANCYANNCIFTRALQSNSSDSEDGAFSIENQNGNQPSGGVFNCLFVNCGSAEWGQACYGAVDAFNSTSLVTVNQCTFVDCVNGVTCGAGNLAYAYVTNSIFHEIGDNVPRNTDASGITLTNGSPELVDGLYPAWTNGLALWSTYTTPYGTNTAAFNDYRDLGVMTISNCMVGSIASEDTSPWTLSPTPPVVGCRLYAGSDSDFTGTSTVTRAIPVFLNRNPDALNPFQLAPSSPGQGMGANLAPLLEPKLAATQAGSSVNIAWTQPIWATGYALESTPSLATPSWTPVAGVLDAGGGSYTVSVPISSAQYFAIRQSP